jgi:hypothetical protein
VSIEVEINESDATFIVDPEHGHRVVFEVRWRRPKGAATERFVVGLKGSDGEGFSAHVLFDRACRSALWRARRYQKAFSKPREIPARMRGAA